MVLIKEKNTNKLYLIILKKTRQVLSHFAAAVTANCCLPRASKKAGHNKLEYRAVKLWNEIDANLKKLSLYTFNKQYKNALLSIY